MKIEPCPFCGSEVRYSLGTLSALCKNPECLYEGPIDDEGAEKHNRLSRIVRAAEAVVEAYGADVVSVDVPLEEREGVEAFYDKVHALVDAVEGGRADG